MIGGPKAVIGIDLEERTHLFHAGHGDAFAQGGIKAVAEPLDVIDDFILHHEPRRIITAIREIRQLALPVRRDKTEAVPTVRLPRVEPLMAFQHDVINASLTQIIGRGHPRLPGANNDRGHMGAGGGLQRMDRHVTISSAL